MGRSNPDLFTTGEGGCEVIPWMETRDLGTRQLDLSAIPNPLEEGFRIEGLCPCKAEQR